MSSLFFCFFLKYFLNIVVLLNFLFIFALLLIIKTEYYGITSIKHIDKQPDKSKI